MAMAMAMAMAIRPPTAAPRHFPAGPIRRRATTAVSPSAGRTRIHRLIEEEGAILVPGCYDALSAAIVQQSAFSAGPPEMAEAARFICAVAPLIPIIADADTGGGNALNVRRTVQDLIAAGAAGCFLEDQAWPKKCGHMRGKQVIPAEEHAAKIASARDVIGDADFFLVARTDAHATSAKSGLLDAISRANLYMEAGADACFVEAPRDDDELKEIGKQTKRIQGLQHA